MQPVKQASGIWCVVIGQSLAAGLSDMLVFTVVQSGNW